ncbi:hypothetical protein LTR53_017064, partial [Teratosphaeriaceae sp. CCFEE 6253]
DGAGVGSEVTVMRGGLSPQLARQVMAARRQIMVQKIAEMEGEIAAAMRRLEDLLRDARHVLVLAPIAPKTREDVRGAAVRLDAGIRWLRRDVWRLKCHRDILAMDVRVDGVEVRELMAAGTGQQSLASPAMAAAGPESARKERAPSLPRLASRSGALLTAARSPPQSPNSPSRSVGRSDRPSTTESIETFMGTDVFQTPPESALDPTHRESYRLPPLQLNVQQQQQQRTDEHRASVSSALLSVSSAGGPGGSLSHASSTSSVRPAHTRGAESWAEIPSPGTREGPIPPTPTAEEREVALLARTTTLASGMEFDGAATVPVPAMPDGKQRSSVRRSLQKTLREAHAQVPGSGAVHRHRKGRESEGTIRSSGGGPGGVGGGSGEGDEAADGTPSLQREKGRFILHGKQASVIQFGGEWPNERMKMRREAWRQSSQSPTEELTPRQGAGGGGGGGRGWEGGEMGTPSTMRGGEESDGLAPESALREDAEAAEAFATAGSRGGRPGSGASGEGEGGLAYFDLSPAWDPESGTRQTAFALAPAQSHDAGAFGADPEMAKRTPVLAPQRGSLVPSDAGTLESSDREDFSLGPRDNRRTALGLPAPAKGTMEPEGLGSARADDGAMAEVGAERGGLAEDPDGESMIMAPIGDEELRRISRQAQTVGVAERVDAQ